MIKEQLRINYFFTGCFKVAVVFIAACVLVGCSGNSTGAGNKSTEQGVYYLSGEKIVTMLSTGNTGEVERDTTGILMIIKIQMAENERNRFRFYGLDGADVSEQGNHRVFPECNDPKQCEVYGTITGEDLLIDVSNGERSYHASGKVYQTYDPYIEMEAEYEHEDILITYNLEGDQKVDSY